MSFRSIALSVLFCLVCCTAAYAADAEKLIGVWERVSSKNLDTGAVNTMPARLIITKEYFSLSGSNPERKKPDKPLAEMTKEELLDRLQVALGHGTYSVSGNKFIRHREHQINPNAEGTDLSDEFSFEGDQLVLRSKRGAAGNSVEVRFKRVE